jgi:hypothetical protein
MAGGKKVVDISKNYVIDNDGSFVFIYGGAVAIPVTYNDVFIGITAKHPSINVTVKAPTITITVE